MFGSNASGAAQTNGLSVAFDLPTLVMRGLDHPRSGDAAMLTDNDLQRMYDRSHCLHPHHGIALSVTLEACERASLIRRVQARRAGFYRRRLPEACLPQYCVYLASDARERDQERPRSCKKPRYEPTSDDSLVRYIKALVWWTMDRNACHVAVALGCFLHGYRSAEIASLAPDFFNQHNIWRVKRRLALQLEARFQSANIFQSDHHTLLTRPPTEHERGLVQHSLAMFAPWGAPHIPSPTPDKSILETYFDWPSAQSDWDRVHALIDPTCVGLPQLIREYNHHFPQGSDMRLEDLDRKLQIPCFNL
jgi:hypothetical protein